MDFSQYEKYPFDRVFRKEKGMAPGEYRSLFSNEKIDN